MFGRKVRVLVHTAYFLDETETRYYFIKVTNGTRRPIQITHIWFAGDPPVHVLNGARPLPAYLHEAEQFETWVPVIDIQKDLTDPRPSDVRVLLTNGKVIRGQYNASVPTQGHVAGGGSGRPARHATAKPGY
jgi:hypothetical protein